MPKKHLNLPDLSPSQREVMEVIWDQGEASAAQVREKLVEQGREVAKNTVRTLLERIEEKGWLVHRQQGRTYLYSAVHTREATTGSKVVALLDRVCGGSAETLMTALLDSRRLSSKELGNIRKMLDDVERKSAKRKGKNNERP